MQALAYRMLGSVSEAEDVLQDAWLRWSSVPLNRVTSPRSYLLSIASRLSIDRLRYRRTDKLNYVGPWLPDPVATDDDPEAELQRLDSINTSLLLVLERLNPVERAVFVLKEAFDYSHEEIADTLGISVANSRQRLRRARQTMSARLDEECGDSSDVVPLVNAFFNAAREGDLAQLNALLAEDVIAYSDGGGRASAAIIPLYGIERVITVFAHLVKSNPDFELTWTRVNEQWGLVIKLGESIQSVTTFEARQGKITRVYTMRNPDKLRHLD